MNKLLESLTKAQLEFAPIRKSGLNPFLKNKYATLDDIVNATQTALANNGLSIIHRIEEKKDKDYLISELLHFDEEEPISTSSCIDKYLKTSEKTTLIQLYGGVITYLKRYHIGMLLNLCTDEDDDGNSAEKGKKDQKPQETSKADKPAENPSGDSVLFEFLNITQKNHLQNWLAKNKATIDFKAISDAYNKHLKLVTHAESLAKVLAVKQEDMVEFMKSVNGGLEQSLITETIAGKQESIDEIAVRFTNYLATKAMPAAEQGGQ